MKTTAERDLSGLPPVLKMPPNLTIPALRALDREQSLESRALALCALRPSVPKRTLLNAYVMPSLSELGFFSGSLRSGRATRIGHLIAIASDAEAEVLVARQLLDMDAERIGLVDWLRDRSIRGAKKRTALTRFIEEKLGSGATPISVGLDRLGKWMGFLITFGVVRETERDGGVTWSINARHLEALRGNESKRALKNLDDEQQRALILEAYANASMRLGTRLYLPISEVRDEIGALLRDRSLTLLDGDIDKILVRAARLLQDYAVTFSPFSGPARGGLQLDAKTYVGFVSLRKRSTATPAVNDARAGKIPPRKRRTAAKGHR